MRFTVILLITSRLFTACTNPGGSIEAIHNSADTLTKQIGMTDSVEMIHDIAEWPFIDSIIDSRYFKNRIGSKARFTEKLVANLNDPNIIDTVRFIEWDSSYVETLSNVYTKTEYLQTLRIDDPAIQFKMNLKVGMTEEIVFKTFNKAYDKTKQYKYFLITFGDGAENYLIFYFENHRVKYISFQPYTG
jgi:hypothetical protein